MANRNARLVEKDIMTGVDDDAAGDSEIVDLAGADKFSCHAIYVDDSSSGAALDFQCSNDRVTWVNIDTQTAISASGQTMIEVEDVDYRYFKVVKSLSGGALALQCLVLVIGDVI